jgi:hydroxyacylglutathione hydrolase
LTDHCRVTSRKKFCRLISLGSWHANSVKNFVELRNQEPDRIAVLDVREPGEVANGAIENSLAIPLGKLGSRLAELDRKKLLVVHCKRRLSKLNRHQYLQRAGFRDIANLIGGFDAWKAASLAYVLPQT